MSAKQRGLGRGLGALIGDFQEEPESGAVTKLPLQKVEPNPDQPRRTFDEEELQALADSIAAHGILQPLAVPLVLLFQCLRRLGQAAQRFLPGWRA